IRKRNADRGGSVTKRAPRRSSSSATSSGRAAHGRTTGRGEHPGPAVARRGSQSRIPRYPAPIALEHTKPTPLGALRSSGIADRTVKDELRSNLLAGLAAGTPLFPEIVGYDESVIPALERGILAGHDVIFLGERGQAKTRLIRHLVQLLDAVTPVVAGCEVNDHPFRPICARCRALI